MLHKHSVSKGFTLIELVIVIVVLGIMSAVVIVSYSDVTASAEDAVKTAAESAVKDAYVIGLAKLGIHPMVTEINDQLTNSNTSAVPTGINVVINNNNYIVLTFRDENCNIPTSAVTQQVYCVDGIINASSPTPTPVPTV